MDPLIRLTSILKPDPAEVKEIFGGEVYTGIQLINGEIGLCATLGNQGICNPEILCNPEFSNPLHRIHLIAYYNARFNSEVNPDAQTDIFEHLDFRGKQIIMIGFFKPVVAKFDRDGIPLYIFDLKEDNPRLTSMSKLEDFAPKAEIAIITSTTLVNQTFERVTSLLDKSCKAYLLGPSSILHPVLFEYPQIQAIYGMQIQSGDSRVIEIVRNNGGTPDFSKFTTKVCITSR